MRLPILVTILALSASAGPAAAVEPLRQFAASFEANDPQRDCAVDATTETGLAERLRASEVQGLCIPPINVGMFTACSQPVAQCNATACFMPFGPTSAASVDAVLGRVSLADAGGSITTRVRSTLFPDCMLTVGFAALTLDLEYATLNDGLDGVILAGLAAPAAPAAPGSPSIGGCPGLGGDIQLIVDVLRNAMLTAYVGSTLARIGEPLDASVCPIVRP
jgi:hypothetical protein